MPQDQGSGRGIKPPSPPSKEEKEAAVASLRINPAGEVVLQSRQPILFVAIPLDSQEVTIHGLVGEWESNKPQVVSVQENGEAVAGVPGTAILTARAGNVKEHVRVTVVEGTSEEFGGKKKRDSQRDAQRDGSKSGRVVSGTSDVKIARKSDPRKKRAHAMPPMPAMFLRDINDDPLPDGETGSLFSPGNGVGAPPGRTTPGAVTPPTAADGTEMPGSENFTFGVPLVGLPGRGLDLSLSLAYNSRAYNKSTDFNGATWMTYDVDSGWPAAGFRLGYGQIEDQGSFGFSLVDPDGTRHPLKFTSTNNYDSNDGTFIHFTGGTGWGSVFYSDGTRVDYGAAGGGIRSYPTKIVDRNGNFVLISYLNGVGPKISSIQDTLGRYVTFFYAANGDLVTITAPGLTNQPDRQVARFYYETITINTSGLFQSAIHVNAPATTRVIRYIYFPNATESGNAHLGFRYDYSAYGMIYQIAKLRGMTVDSTATNQTGTVTSEGLEAARTTYNYPTTANSLSDVPAYTRRTDDWAGRTTGMPGTGEAPYFTFGVDTVNGITTVTAPDQTVTETHAIVATGQWNDGLVNDTIIKQGANGPTLARTEVNWEHDGTQKNPRPHDVKFTNDASQVTTTVYTYSTYNNVTVISIRGFDNAEVRRVENEYQTDAAWTSRYLLHLVTSARVFAGGAASTSPTSRVDFAYDTAGANLTGRSGIIMHEPAFNPSSPSYNSGTDKRGNVVSITNYSDAPNGAGAITDASTYDIAGNVVTAQVNCCQQKLFSYAAAFSYAYNTSVTDGTGPTVTTSTDYDLNTGLVKSTTDENGEDTSFYYYGDSLRPEHVDNPDGSAVSFYYNDVLTADAANRKHYYTRTSTKLDASRNIDNYVFFDGRGAATQTFSNWTQVNGWSTKDTEYDPLGRAYRVSHPYYTAGYGQSAINPANLWTTQTLDNLGRVTAVNAPSGDAQNPTTTSTTVEYSGVYTTLTDASGKKRRQKVDALGHVVRLDEPDLSNNLGPVDTPVQSTSYEYDPMDDVIHITQGAQHRYFKYNSLGLLTHQRDVEQAAPYTTSDSVAGNTQWSRKIEYNSQSLVQNSFDARQIKTHFDYDGLNRVSQISYYLSDGVTPDPNTAPAFYYYDSQQLPNGAPVFDRGSSAGRLVAMLYGSNSAVTGSYFGYDTMGRVKTQRQVTGSSVYSLDYGYNLGGLVTSETYPTGRTINYDFDEAGRLSKVSENATTIYAEGFEFEPHGGLKNEKFGNGALHSMAYNRALQPSEIKLKQSVSGSELQRFNYSYGVVNQTDGSVDTTKNNGQVGRIDGYINGVKQWDQRYSYDPLLRLTTAGEYRGDNAQQVWQTTYTYDRYGNRFQSGSGNSNINYTPVITTDIVEATNRFISNGTTPISYDAAGNITSDAKFRGMNYSYDANGRMTSTVRQDGTSAQSSVYDCAGQRVRTSANGVTRTTVYDIFGQIVADYTGASGSVLERENIYRGGQLLSVIESGASSAAAPSGLSATPNGSTSITLNWTAASGATNYRVERRATGQAYTLLGTTASTSLTDSGVTAGSAYVYKVCAANAQGNCVSTFSNVALGSVITFATDPTITTIQQDPTGQTVTTVKAAHITELRTAVNTIRNLGGLSNASWSTTVASGSTISKNDVQDLRIKLDEGLQVLSIQLGTYTDQPLAGAPNGTLIKGAHITELRQRVRSGAGIEGSGGGGNCYKSLSQFVKDFYQGSLKRQPTPAELSQWTTTLALAQLQGQAALLDAAQDLGTALFPSAEYLALGTSPEQYVTDLYAGYLQRLPDPSGYQNWLNALNSATREQVRQGFALSVEFQNNVAALCTPAGTSGGVKYMLLDPLGSPRAIMDNGTYGSSSVIARHDYLPFGEEIWANTGMRTPAQGYNVTDKVRKKFALLERDDVTGLDHTKWRKYESIAGRWTSPDPAGGSMSLENPQTLNRYTYANNDPMNSIDPSGLVTCWGYFVVILHFIDGHLVGQDTIGFIPLVCWGDGPVGGDGPGGGGPGGRPQNPGNAPLGKKDQQKYDKEKKKVTDKGLSERCKEWLSSHGVNPQDVITALDSQQAFSGPKSTTSVIDAGIIDFGDPDYQNYQTMHPVEAHQYETGSLKNYFKTYGNVGAATGIFPGGQQGATIAERSNVYFRGVGISAKNIFHEAMHAATGLGDARLAAKLGLKGSEAFPNQIDKALKEHGCT